MTPLTLQQIQQACGVHEGSDTRVITSICTDTRAINPGCLFIAIKGENHDGHDHLQAAATAGAVAAMVDRPVAANIPLIQVDSTRQAMGRLANYVRRQLKGKVIAVAGSNGKTGTKNLIQSVLKGARSGTISPKSFNNDIGVPTTIFAADPSDDYLVLEIGTNHPGEILNLTKIAEPDIAIITSIGAEHLEFLGDLDGVTHENALIIQGLNPKGLLVINGDHPPLLSAIQKYPGAVITFGIDGHNDVRATDIRCTTEGIHFRIQTQTPARRYPDEADCSAVELNANIEHPTSNTQHRTKSGTTNPPFDVRCSMLDVRCSSLLRNSGLFIPLMGRHTAANALAAIIVARHLGLTDDQIRTGLSTATGPEMRLQLQTAGSVKILNDSYNANPHSMRAGLETLRDMETNGRRVAILGDMFELGNTAEEHHRDLGRFAAECELDQLICIGKHAAVIAGQAIQAGVESALVAHYPTVAACAADIPSLIGEDDLVLLKASNGMKLWTLVQTITAASAERGLRRLVNARTQAVAGQSQVVKAAP